MWTLSGSSGPPYAEMARGQSGESRERMEARSAVGPGGDIKPGVKRRTRAGAAEGATEGALGKRRLLMSTVGQRRRDDTRRKRDREEKRNNETRASGEGIKKKKKKMLRRGEERGKVDR